MFIYHKPVQRIGQVYHERSKSQRLQKTDSTRGSQDKVTLSSQGREMQLMLQQIQGAPDIRPEAEELKIAVKTGTYQVNGKEVAMSMLKSWK